MSGHSGATDVPFSDLANFDRGTKRADQMPDVLGIAGENGVASRARSDHDGSVHDVGCLRPSKRRSGRAALRFRQWIDGAAEQETRHLWLRPPAPRLSEDRGWDGRAQAALQQATMQCPDEAIVALRGNEHARVVGVAAHVVRRRRVGWSRSLSAAASSSSLNAPCSASHAATAARPFSICNAAFAASFSQAETLNPRRRAARAAPSAVPSSKAMDNFLAAIPTR